MPSSDIYPEFKPTFLYIKQHSVTGKLYFGKTTRDPEEYLGSGDYWKYHINKHGEEHVINLWYCLFLNKDDCVDFALNFSNQHNIVKSEEWLNLKEENGLDGGRLTPHSDETKAKMSLAGKGKPRKQIICPHCKMVGGEGNMQRWHFDNCKSRLF